VDAYGGINPHLYAVHNYTQEPHNRFAVGIPYNSWLHKTQPLVKGVSLPLIPVSKIEKPEQKNRLPER
jgi:hypothetical protein